MNRDLHFIEVTDAGSPLYEIWVNGRKAALLFEPAFEEMFWCSYRLAPMTKNAMHFSMTTVSGIDVALKYVLSQRDRLLAFRSHPDAVSKPFVKANAHA